MAATTRVILNDNTIVDTDSQSVEGQTTQICSSNGPIASCLPIDALRLIKPLRHGDERGHFVETWNSRAFAAAGIECEFVQDNASFSVHAGTIRGLHFQRAPRAQDKLIRVIRGAIFDVAVDIRPDSPTFGQHASAILTADGGEQLFVPKGFVPLARDLLTRMVGRRDTPALGE